MPIQAIVVVAALTLRTMTGQQRTTGSPLPVVGRSMVTTRYGIVASSQPLAAQAGVQILERGGNAVDAAIAANATIGLMEPTGNGIGGDLFAIVYDAKTNTSVGLNASGWAPSGLTPEFLASKGIKEMPRTGIYSVTVPGVVAGWDALRARFGTKGLSELLAPAIWYAEEGFPVTEIVSATWALSVPLLKAQANAGHTFLIDGHVPRQGEVFRNPDLARSLRMIADQGPSAYYRGPIADAILAISEEHGGTFSAADLTEYEPEWVDPIQTTYRGWAVSEIPPNGQGIAALMMLNLMERFPLGAMGFHSRDALHVMIEAKKLAYADMLRYVGDPRFASVPVSQMLDKKRAEARAGLIELTKARCDATPSELESIGATQGSDTIYLTVVDKDGNIVSLIQSNYAGFGSGMVPAGTGFMLQNRGALFTLRAGQANTLGPRKRPLHTIIPGFMEKDGVRIGFGIMGGWNQSQAHAQFVANIADYGMTIQQALEAGRFTKNTFDGCDVTIESLVPAGVRDALASLGHEITVVAPRSAAFGWGQAVMVDAHGVKFGASEPRHDGLALPQAPPVFDPGAEKLP